MAGTARLGWMCISGRRAEKNFLIISSNMASRAVLGWLGISGQNLNGTVAKNGWLGRPWLAGYGWQMTGNEVF